MPDRSVRVLGLVLSILYATSIVWLYVRQPQTIAEVTGSIAAGDGAYRINQTAFDDGLALFRRDQFEAARAAFERADPAGRDARTQFYIAYSYYRSGWGRLYQDDRYFKLGLDRVDKAIDLAPVGRLVVDDPDLTMHSADELRAELVQGMKTEPSDFNPMRIFGKRK
jgi:hypothetical protein